MGTSDVSAVPKNDSSLKDNPGRRRRLLIIIAVVVIAIVAVIVGVTAGVLVTQKRKRNAEAAARRAIVSSVTRSVPATSVTRSVPATSATDKPVPTPSCAVSVKNTCFSNLALAIEKAQSGDTVTINQNMVVSSPINIDQASLTLEGKNGATVTSMLDKNNIHAAILNVLANKEQTIILRDLKFDHKGVYGSVLRTPSLGDGTEVPPEATYSNVHLNIERCSVNGFSTGARGGGAFFVANAGEINISHSIFTKNKCVIVEEFIPAEKKRFGAGGGVMWIRSMRGPLKITNSTFVENSHEFEHGGGGGVFITDQGFLAGPFTPTVTIDRLSKFMNNSAASGGAFTIINNFAPIFIDGQFEDNVSTVPSGWNGRSGAMWVQFVRSNCTFSGIFNKNRAIKVDAPKTNTRGPTLTVNVVFGSGRVILSGTFIGNSCPQSPQTGMVFDGASPSGALRKGSQLIVRYTANIADNGILTSNIISLNNNRAGKLPPTRVSRAQWEKQVNDKQDLVIPGVN